jgi:hypothetical protein
MLLEPFTFTANCRRALRERLDKAGVHAAAIGDMEAAVETFRVLRASPGPTADTAARLRRLADASEQFTAALAALDDDGRDMVTRRMARQRFPSRLGDLADAHRILTAALDVLEQELGPRLARGGRPREGARVWLLRELCDILGRHHRQTRRRVLEIMARHGSTPTARFKDLPIAACAAIILRALGEPVPATLARLTRKVKNPPPIA